MCSRGSWTSVRVLNDLEQLEPDENTRILHGACNQTSKYYESTCLWNSTIYAASLRHMPRTRDSSAWRAEEHCHSAALQFSRLVDGFPITAQSRLHKCVKTNLKQQWSAFANMRNLIPEAWSQADDCNIILLHRCIFVPAAPMLHDALHGIVYATSCTLQVWTACSKQCKQRWNYMEMTLQLARSKSADLMHQSCPHSTCKTDVLISL